MAIEKFLEFAKTENISDKLAGKIIILPLLNPSGFSYSKRTVYEDNQDLNRSF